MSFSATVIISLFAVRFGVFNLSPPPPKQKREESVRVDGLPAHGEQLADLDVEDSEEVMGSDAQRTKEGDEQWEGWEHRTETLDGKQKSVGVS